MSVTNPTRLSQSGKQTVIEDDTEFKGKLSSKSPVVVKGEVDGDIQGPSLHVAGSGTVTGHVKVGELRSEGTIGGEFDADTIHLAGTVKDNTVIRAKSLEVKLAPAQGRLQVTFGACELDVGEVPSKEEAVEASKGKKAGKDGKEAGKAAAEDAATQVGESDSDGKGGRSRSKRDTQSPAQA